MKKVLVIDDADLMRLRLTEILTELGCEVVGEARDGNEGVDKFKNLNPDLVTLDISMPEKNGVEVLREILGFNSKSKVVVISALGQKAQILEALKLGAKAFIVKPFDKQQVKDKISTLINVA